MQRSSGAGGARRVIPDFLVSSYTAALQRAKTETKVIMVVLTCEEHESDADFKQCGHSLTRRGCTLIVHRSGLADSELVRTLNAEGILAWGGDVRERDAHQGE